MLGLADQVGGDEGRVGGVVGDDADLGRAVLAVDADDALQDPLRGGDVDVAGAGDHVDRGALVGAVGEHRQRLGAADGVDFPDAEERAGGEHRRVRQAAELLLRRGRDRDLVHARRLRGDHVHDHRGRVGDEPAGDVDAGPLDREEPGGDGQAGGGLGVPALGELRLVDDPGAAGRLLERVSYRGVQRCQCVVDDVLRHPGALEVDAVEPVGVLADGDAAADPDVLGQRPDQVDRAVDVEGGAGQHAGEGGVGQARRAPAAQVNVGGNGTGPAVRSHPPSLRTPAPDYRVAVGVALGWSREALVAAVLGLALGGQAGGRRGRRRRRRVGRRRRRRCRDRRRRA